MSMCNLTTLLHEEVHVNAVNDLNVQYLISSLLAIKLNVQAFMQAVDANLLL